ncbi:MAG: SGNH/GDSL hydrolase family protein [Planctomycetota bacterium]
MLFGLGILEILLAVFHPVPFASTQNMYFDPDPYTGYRLRPNSIGRFGEAIGRHSLAKTNSHGHRDGETTVQKPDGTFRVLVLGDSMTFGTNVRQEEAYPHVLELLLNERFDAPMEVVSTGVGGWTPFQYAQYYEHYGLRFSPDLLLVGFFVGNDTFDQMNSTDELPTAILGRRVFRKVRIPVAATIKIYLYERLHCVRLFINGGRFVIEEEDLDYDAGEPRDTDRLSRAYMALQSRKLNNHLERTERREERAKNGVFQMVRLKRMADRGSAPLVVVLMPDENQVNSLLRERLLRGKSIDRYDFLMPQSMLAGMLDAEGISTLDIFDDFLADERRLFMNDSHWRPEGHWIAAEAILEEIVPLIENRLAGR